MVSFVMEKPNRMSESQNVVVSEAARSIIPNNSSAPPGFISISKKKLLKNLEIINDGERINAWVDSMRASSPTHPKSLPSSISLQQQLSSWIMQHPSALEMFEKIKEASGGKQIVIFLDYDGTLSPIVDDPDKAFMSSKVYNFVKLAELYYAGSHGMDIKGPAKGFSRHKRVKQSLLYQPASDYLPMIDEVYRQLLEKTKSTPGVIVENNKFCASVHFRCVDEKKWSELVLQVRSVLKEYPRLKLNQGRKVFEIRPMIEWDKGKALEFLLESLGFGNSNNVFPVYIGDDRTDEDAFKLLRDRGEGCGVLVSKFPKDTDASYYLQDPSEVMNFLQRLVAWKQMQPRV
ncbi:hypothetical protein BRARA_C00407 [Brassica rapa]|uniref:Trehalose 6-phosphate phosphatase n=1 Tax=Brassica campestris TaxID=3711 RepID=A0A397ZZB3_BRACM|nr:hypothetical protein BRARA_C00407 [Brassica rapa]